MQQEILVERDLKHIWLLFFGHLSPVRLVRAAEHSMDAHASVWDIFVNISYLTDERALILNFEL